MLCNSQCSFGIGELSEGPKDSAHALVSREMATVCGIHNFSIGDLTRPDATRFRHHLSGVLNMAKFR